MNFPLKEPSLIPFKGALNSPISCPLKGTPGFPGLRLWELVGRLAAASAQS